MCTNSKFRFAQNNTKIRNPKARFINALMRFISSVFKSPPFFPACFLLRSFAARVFGSDDALDDRVSYIASCTTGRRMVPFGSHTPQRAPGGGRVCASLAQTDASDPSGT